MTESVARTVTAGARWLPAYGASELPVLAANPVDDPAAWRLDSAGLPAPGVELRVVADLDDGRVLAAGETGEIQASQPVQALVADTLAGYKQVREVVVVETIPRLPSGKVLRRVLPRRVVGPARGPRSALMDVRLSPEQRALRDSAARWSTASGHPPSGPSTTPNERPSSRPRWPRPVGGSCVSRPTATSLWRRSWRRPSSPRSWDAALPMSPSSARPSPPSSGA